MYNLLQQIVDGISTGSAYACLGLALVLIYQSTHHINLAQGEMAMFSTFVAWVLLRWGVPFWLAALLTLAFGFLFGYVIERLAIRPLRKAPEISVLVVMIGLFMGINAIAGALFGYLIETFPSPFPFAGPFGTTLISGHSFGMICVMIVVMLVLFAFLRFTKIGLAMRASAENSVSSQLSGIPVSLMLALGWGLSSLIGAIAGMLIAPVVFLEPNMMAGVLLYAFAAALLGGIDNPWGAVAGGIIVGVLENLVGTYIVGTDLKLTVALVVIVVVLLVRPSGLFGRTLVSRV